VATLNFYYGMVWLGISRAHDAARSGPVKGRGQRPLVHSVPTGALCSAKNPARALWRRNEPMPAISFGSVIYGNHKEYVSYN